MNSAIHILPHKDIKSVGILGKIIYMSCVDDDSWVKWQHKKSISQLIKVECDDFLIMNYYLYNFLLFKKKETEKLLHCQEHK